MFQKGMGTNVGVLCLIKKRARKRIIEQVMLTLKVRNPPQLSSTARDYLFFFCTNNNISE